MLDVVSVVSLAFLFGLSLAYLRGCDSLKGSHS